MQADPVVSAREAGLRYVSDQGAGLQRLKRGHGFVYVNARGQSVRDPNTLARIKSLAIPPAWRDVWICPDPRGHLQATGHDERGRKQYRYHPDWRQVRDQTKYHSLIEFARALPMVRRAVKRHLRLPGLPRDKVLAAIVRLMETTFIRVGNDEYARENGSFGLTTFHNRHVHVRGAALEFRFRGKSGVFHTINLHHPRLARIVRRCQELPGQELFAYLDDQGSAVDVTSADVNDYLRRISGGDFTAKDFRTWSGTVLAAQALGEVPPSSSKAQAKRSLLRAVESVSHQLGNTAAVCRKCYIHPAIVDSFLEGSLTEQLHRAAANKRVGNLRGLKAEEAAVLTLLRAKAKQTNAPRSHRAA